MAEAILLRGRILTGDWDGNPATEALWIEDGIVRATGGRALTLGAGARPVDLPAGACAVPGFWDSHLHLLSYGLSLGQVRLEACTSGEEVAEAVRAALGDRPSESGAPLIGHGWTVGRWRGGPPHRRFLDPLTDRVPIGLWNHDHHSIWLNGVALGLAGVDATTPDPGSGRVERDPDGSPTGVLRDAATRLADGVWPEPTLAEAEAAILRAQDALLAVGVTAVCAMGEGAQSVRVLSALRRDGRLRLRVALYLPLGQLAALAATGVGAGFGDDRLWLGGVKGFMDGALGSRTAWMRRPYRSGGSGLAMPLADELPDVVRRARDAHLRLAIHAIGDRAVAEVAAALATGPSPTGPDRMEHAQLVDPRTRQRWPARDLVASVQPVHLTDDLELMAAHWGRRSRHAFPLQSLRQRGVRLVFGSDAPVSDPDPLRGLAAAVLRRRSDGPPFYPEEALTPAEALRAYAAEPAQVEGRPHLGRLTPGSPADIAVLSADPLADGADLYALRVTATLLGGAPYRQ
jgi:predicted amidohydrolase YtcJ